MGTLFLVATPIGNLEDISQRALRVLREASLIAAEDTRVTQKLLSHYGIHKRTVSYFEHNKLARLDQIINALAQGDVALVSDAGTPALNDPGYELVRAALAAGHSVSAIPGAASPIAALVSSGLPSDSFLYLGYLPRKAADRRAAIERISDLPYTLVFLESPHRLIAALHDLHSVLGDRHVAVARELTKLHEEVWRGDLAGAARHFTSPRGEFVLVIAGQQPSARKVWTDAQVRTAVRKRLASGDPPTVVAAELALESGWNRRDVYKLVLSRTATSR